MQHSDLKTCPFFAFSDLKSTQLVSRVGAARFVGAIVLLLACRDNGSDRLASRGTQHVAAPSDIKHNDRNLVLTAERDSCSVHHLSRVQQNHHNSW